MIIKKKSFHVLNQYVEAFFIKLSKFKRNTSCFLAQMYWFCHIKRIAIDNFYKKFRILFFLLLSQLLHISSSVQLRKSPPQVLHLK